MIWSRNSRARVRPPSSFATRSPSGARAARTSAPRRASTRIASLPRARRMRQAEQLFAATKDASKSPEARLQARFDYAAFLADNPDGIFFNDSIWHGIQTWAVTPGPTDIDPSGPPMTSLGFGTRASQDSAERAHYQALDSGGRNRSSRMSARVQIFDGIVREAARPRSAGRRRSGRSSVSAASRQSDSAGCAKSSGRSSTGRWLAAN